MTAAARLDKVDIRLGRTQVINSFSLELSQGVTGLLGPNGAGKTTLMRVLATLLPPTYGDLFIVGRHIDTEKLARSARKRIGYLPQKFGFFPSFTAQEFVQYCGWLKGLSDARARARSAEVLHRLGLDSVGKTRLRKLSGGMIQRVGIAQALISEPDLLLLDEPTAGLDPQQRAEFRAIIKSLTNTTVLLSTHLTEDIAATCDSVIVMQQGSKRFQGTLGELIAHGSQHESGVAALESGYVRVLDGTGVGV